MTDEAKHDLEDHIELLKKLDKLRIESGMFRNEGINILNTKYFKNSSKETYTCELYVSEVKDLNVFRAIYRKPDLLSIESKECRNAFIKACGEVNFIQIHNHDLPVWYAANLLHTLATVPGGAHSKVTFYCYYLIIRELYTADSPEWSIGGARASEGGQVTAYMTSECVNALLALANAHRDTGAYIATVGAFLIKNKQLIKLETLDNLKDSSQFKHWINTERDRAVRSCFLSLQQNSKHLTLQIDNLPHDIDPKEVDFGNLFLTKCLQFSKNLEKAINDCRDNIVLVLEEINEYRSCTDKEETITSRLENRYKNLCDHKLDHIKPDSKMFNKVIRSHQGHHIARNAIMDALNESIKALEIFKDAKGDDKDKFEESKKILNAINNEVHKALIPTRQYLSTILDRELATDTELHYGQQEELAWAAISYGKLINDWERDDRLALATRRLSETISDHGYFPNRRHFHFDENKDTSYKVEASCVINAYSQLLKNVRSIEIDNEYLVKRLLRIFHDTRINDKPQGGWRKDASPAHGKFDKSATTQAVHALDEINSMLDERINQLILEHFSVKWPNRELKETPYLDSLFYADYGMLLINDEELRFSISLDVKLEEIPKLKRDESVAVSLLRMQAHVKKIRIDKDPFNSLVLYGPAGTGKTMLVESLAKTCDVPMLEITPSDIVKGGVDNVERRARTVFEALSLLTRVVILFDEFDPVLKRRDPDNNNPSVFSFLTPGMLPKLKSLHENANNRSVAYVLITNLVGSLDEAAIREGRFDKKIGIYPPDLLSRVGRFFDQINNRGIDLNKIIGEHLVKIIEKTGGKGMTTLGKPGWFTCPKSDKKIKLGTPFHYVSDSDETNVPTWPEPEQKLNDIKENNIKIPVALKEYCEWSWIENWDNQLEDIQKKASYSCGSKSILISWLNTIPDHIDIAIKK